MSPARKTSRKTRFTARGRIEPRRYAFGDPDCPVPVPHTGPALAAAHGGRLTSRYVQNNRRYAAGVISSGNSGPYLTNSRSIRILAGFWNHASPYFPKFRTVAMRRVATMRSRVCRSACIYSAALSLTWGNTAIIRECSGSSETRAISSMSSPLRRFTTCAARALATSWSICEE